MAPAHWTEVPSDHSKQPPPHELEHTETTTQDHRAVFKRKNNTQDSHFKHGKVKDAKISQCVITDLTRGNM